MAKENRHTTDPNKAQSGVLLLKFNISIKDVLGEELVDCEFQISCSLFPTITLSPFQGKSITFPINSFKNVKDVSIEAVSGKDSLKASMNISEELTQLEENFKNRKDSASIIAKEENVTFLKGHREIGQLYVELEIICLGAFLVADEGFDEPVETFDFESRYDEYKANVSGHSLLVKILRKKPEQEELCLCEQGGIQKRKETSNRLKFQLPEKDTMDKTLPFKALTNSVLDGFFPPDSFSIKIGKKSAVESSEGRLELEIKAPDVRLADNEECSKQMVNKNVQTDPEVKERKPKNKANKKK